MLAISAISEIKILFSTLAEAETIIELFSSALAVTLVFAEAMAAESETIIAKANIFFIFFPPF
jgi:hypothetical protein